MAREFWIKKCGHGDFIFPAKHHDLSHEVIHVREVLPNESDSKKVTEELVEAFERVLKSVPYSTVEPDYLTEGKAVLERLKAKRL